MKRSALCGGCSDLSSYPGRSKHHRLIGDGSLTSCNQTSSSSFVRFQRSRDRRLHRCSHGSDCCPKSLSDLSARVAAAAIPFELVEERYPRVPEPVLRKLITWSFPRSEADIRRYSSIDGVSADSATGFDTFLEHRLSEQCTESENDGERFNSDGSCRNEGGGQDATFKQGVKLASYGAVQQAIQIGFHLTALILDKKHNPSNPQLAADFQGLRSFNVAVTFDRCKVTSSTCNCGKGVFFCRHVVALLIYRMRHPTKVKIRTPISDSLCQLNRDQLQKLTQYLLARHAQALPTAQEIIDKFCDPGSTINVVHGAPDPTAGAGYRDDDRWSMNDDHVTNHIRHLLKHSNERSSITQLHRMMKKIREMMKVRDCNGARLLSICTTELLSHGNKLRMHLSIQAYTSLWDEIALLWTCVVANPNEEKKKKKKILQQLRMWNENPQCPPAVIGSPDENLQRKGRSVLYMAVCAGSLSWNDPHLKNILRSDDQNDALSQGGAENSSTALPGGFAHFNRAGQSLWHEYVPTACTRVEALRTYGYSVEAVRLAVAVARTIREKAMDDFKLHNESSDLHGRVDMDRNPGLILIGYPLNPVRILIDTLTNVYDNSIEEILKLEDGCTQNALKREAVEVCLLAIGEQRRMPLHSSSQRKTLWCEKELIDHLTKMQFDDVMILSLRNITNLLLDGGWRSGLSSRVHRESFPTHLFATFLFNSLLPHDRDLAFKVGLRCMRMPILDIPDEHRPRADNHPSYIDPQVEATSPRLRAHDRQEEVNFPEDIGESFHLTYPPTWAVMTDLENHQYELASAMLQAAKGEVMLLPLIVESVQKHVRNTSKMYQLSQDAYKCASSQVTTSLDSTMLNVAMQLAMQVLSMTIVGRTSESWQRNEMVGWLVTCATEIGLCALLSIIKTWYNLFTPVEACTIVAGCVISANTAMRLSLDPRQREELYQNVCHMAVQCAVKDPQSCGLCSLTLSETYSPAFNNIYHVIIDAASKRRIDSAQLFTTARYLDQRGLHKRAFVVAYSATRRINAPFNYDAHPAASDLLWTTQLAQSLGIKELKDLILLIVNKVRCATVLSDILRACTSHVSGRLPSFIGNFPNRDLRADRPPLLPLLEASINSYVSTIHNKLGHISPRHYTEFIEFLNKARETFFLAPDGMAQFARLLTNLKMIYKGKKKLLNLVAHRFG